MVDLRTHYLGLGLRSPLVASASPLTGTLEGLRRLEQAGAGAVVLPSLFEEQVTHELLEAERLLVAGAHGRPAAASYPPGSTPTTPAHSCACRCGGPRSCAAAPRHRSRSPAGSTAAATPPRRWPPARTWR